MNRQYITHYSHCLQREMHLLVYGHGGLPLLAFPCQDGMCDNWEGFQMPETIGDYIDSGRVQLFCVDTVDKESWSDENGDPAHRAYMQEQYYHYIVDEALPMIRDINGTGMLPVTTGCSLGATHAVITFFRRPDLFGGCLALSGCYDAQYFWHGWMNDNVYNNSPVHFLANLPNDHFYVDMYNHRKPIICVGQGAWEDEGRRTTAILRDIFASKGINAWTDFWGYDVNHDWPWWYKQAAYFIPKLLEG